MGRRMFDHGEGPWGDDPPFRKQVFVLTHRTRPPLVKGETTFNFVDGLDEALAGAREAAGGCDVSVASAHPIRQCLAAGELDELSSTLSRSSSAAASPSSRAWSRAGQGAVRGGDRRSGQWGRAPALPPRLRSFLLHCSSPAPAEAVPGGDDRSELLDGAGARPPARGLSPRPGGPCRRKLAWARARPPRRRGR